MNYDLFKAINNLSGNRYLDDVMKVLAKDAIVLSFIVLVILALLRLRQGQLRSVVAVGAALVLTFLISLAMSAAVSERRPFQSHRVHQLIAHAGGQSFPSDHATAAFGVALAVAAFWSWRWGAALFVLALAIGFARVYDGIHYPSDIAGGLVAAIIGVGVTYVVVSRIGARSGGRGVARVG